MSTGSSGPVTPPFATTSATCSPAGRCPAPASSQVDPFLFLNHHGPQVYPPATPACPSAASAPRLETVTFILAGELAHRDTAGHESVIAAGGVQWMTAGRGLIHSELSPEQFKAPRRTAGDPASCGSTCRRA